MTNEELEELQEQIKKNIARHTVLSPAYIEIDEKTKMTNEEKQKLLDEIRPQGDWIYNAYDENNGNWHCSNCGSIKVMNGFTNYCPNCGADMRK